MIVYLDIPVDFGGLYRKKEMSVIELRSSIHNNLHLILTTSYGEVKHNPQFGSLIWEYNFENTITDYYLKDELRKSIKKSIKENEKRLVKTEIDLRIDQVELTKKSNSYRIKTEVTVKISGLIDKTNEEFSHTESFFIGPLSY